MDNNNNQLITADLFYTTEDPEYVNTLLISAFPPPSWSRLQQYLNPNARRGTVS